VVACAEGQGSRGEVVVVAGEIDADIFAEDGEEVICAAGEMEFGVVGLPAVFVVGGVKEVDGEDEAIAAAADPCAGGTDVDVAEEIVGGVGDEGAVFDVGAGEGGGGAGGPDAGSGSAGSGTSGGPGGSSSNAGPTTGAGGTGGPWTSAGNPGGAAPGGYPAGGGGGAGATGGLGPTGPTVKIG